MTSTDFVSTDHLRLRAKQLRALAGRLHNLQVLDCYRAAGSDTWVGPSPQRCDDVLRGLPGTLRTQADSLGREARRLERLADEIDARARLTGPR